MARVTTVRTAPARTATAVLLRRRGLLYLPAFEAAAATDVPDPIVVAGVTLLEADLIERGLLMGTSLRRRLEHADPATLAGVGTQLLSDVDWLLGADRTLVPLFRGFPRSTPVDTLALWVDRVLAVLAQNENQPCVLCGRDRTVVAVAPCAHLVCRACFDGSDYSACPICYRALDPGDPFLQPRPATGRLRERTLPWRAQLVGAGDDILADAHAEVAALLARPSALSPQDLDDLLDLLTTHERSDLSWLPPQIPGRETNVQVLDWLLETPDHWATTLPEVGRRLTTATDALRLLSVLSGGTADLVRPVRIAAVPRPLRHTVLAALDRLDPRTLVEDLRRHERRWLRAAERLHPFEHLDRYPIAAAAFAALRRTPLVDVRLAAAVELAGLPVADGRIGPTGFGSRLETHLERGDVPAAVRLLANRPGEFVRRLNALLTRDPVAADAVLAAVPGAAREVAPAVLVGALGALRVRAGGHGPRVMFPKGADAKAHVAADDRQPLDPELVDRATDMLRAELLDRCAALEPVEVAVVDARLTELTAPFTQRVTSRALVTLPRGSRLPVPDAARLRLFLHWMQSERRVDLDLSVAAYDAGWQHIGTCDYTSLRFAGDAAVHSGDRTDAPPPEGASEFLDLDFDLLTRAGARYLVVNVFSYNNVAFDDMAEAFAGVMALSVVDGPVFDARAVEQRFDLAGRARSTVPFVLDLDQRTMHWLDVARGVTGTFHAVHRYADQLAALGEALTGYFASPARVRLGEVALWHAAARARTVVLRADDGRLSAYSRLPDETVDSFVSRLASPAGADPALPPAPADLAFLWRGDLPVAPGAQVYALYPGGLDPATVRRLSAEDLVSCLARP
jgi:hypothetical protein